MSGDATVPVRMRLSRKKGFNLQEASRAINGLEAVNVGRPTMWGNYAAVRAGTPAGPQAVRAFECWVADEASWAWKGRARIDLAGRNLACWCALDAPCHADVLLRLAADEPNPDLLPPPAVEGRR